MKQWAQKQTGFTIVELLIVVVVIAILAAVTIVAYTGIKNRAETSALQNGLSQVSKKVLAYAALNTDNYPASLTDAGISASEAAKYQYTSDNTVSPKTYAVSVSKQPGSDVSFYISSTQQNVTNGIAPGHNLIQWKKPEVATAPVQAASGVTIDTGVFRTSGASIRLAPGATGRPLRSSPITVEVGKVVTVSLWILTDASWDGSANNSKIRFGGVSDGSLLAACGYNGAKATWTLVTCSRTATAAYPGMTISVGNDGSTGNIWLDDISLSLQ